MRVLVHTADIQDSEGAAWLLADVCHAFPDLQHIWVNTGYKEWVIQTAKTSYAITLEQVAKPAGQSGFAVQPQRWVIERTFAWLGRSRRLRTDDERLPENSESVVYIGAIRLMLRRLTK
ncbi:MAG: transposase [Chloroflexota bacterium]